MSSHDQESGRPVQGASAEVFQAEHAPPLSRMGFGQRAVVALLLSVVLVPPAAGFFSFFSGTPLRLLASSKDSIGEESEASPTGASTVSLVPGQLHTIDVPNEVCVALGIRKGNHDAVAAAQVPTAMRPLILPGSTAFDPTRLARIRARFAPARVVQVGQIRDRPPAAGRTLSRELRPGDHVAGGDVLGIFSSVDVGSRKNDLLDALGQLALDQRILDDAEKNAEAVPGVFLLTYQRAVQGDRNAISRALNNLKVWDIPQSEIDELHAEAAKLTADKDAWLKTPEGRWVRGEKQSIDRQGDEQGPESPWTRVTLRAPFSGVIVESNVHQGEMVVDNTVNLFQLADVNRMLFIASCPEESLPALNALVGAERRWTVGTVGVGSSQGLPGTIDEISYLIDPSQHTAVVKGYFENHGGRVRGGQYGTATVDLRPPKDVVEIPSDALLDDGKQCQVFVQPDPRHIASRSGAFR